MQVGDLVRLKNTVTGDGSNRVRLWRDRVPLLVLEILPWKEFSGRAVLLDATISGRHRNPRLDEHRLEVISRASR